MSPSMSTNTGAEQLVAFFRDREDAYAAIEELRDAGFTNKEIGLAFQGDSASGTATHETHDKSTWQKIKDFFTGGDEDTDNDTAYSNNDIGQNYQHFSFSDEQWDYYRSGIGQGGAIVTVRANPARLADARNILQDNDGDLRTSGFDRSQFASTRAGTSAGSSADISNEEQRLQLRGEMLRTYKERVGTGEVRLRKEVVSENRSIDVPVTREEVVIERVGASDASPISGNIGEGQEVRIPVSEERVHVQKEPVVTGEVRVGKRAVQDTQRVDDTVRREEVLVEKEGDVNVNEDATPKRKKPAA